MLRRRLPPRMPPQGTGIAVQQGCACAADHPHASPAAGWWSLLEDNSCCQAGRKQGMGALLLHSWGCVCAAGRSAPPAEQPDCPSAWGLGEQPKLRVQDCLKGPVATVREGPDSCCCSWSIEKRVQATLDVQRRTLRASTPLTLCASPHNLLGRTSCQARQLVFKPASCCRCC